MAELDIPAAERAVTAGALHERVSEAEALADVIREKHGAATAAARVLAATVPELIADLRRLAAVGAGFPGRPSVGSSWVTGLGPLAMVLHPVTRELGEVRVPSPPMRRADPDALVEDMLSNFVVRLRHRAAAAAAGPAADDDGDGPTAA